MKGFRMTIGNAVVANADLSLQYFPRDGRRVTYRSLCVSMALGSLPEKGREVIKPFMDIRSRGFFP